MTVPSAVVACLLQTVSRGATLLVVEAAGQAVQPPGVSTRWALLAATGSTG